METVGIVRVERSDVRDAVRRAVGLVGGIGRYVPPGARVMVKPNLANALN